LQGFQIAVNVTDDSDHCQLLALCGGLANTRTASRDGSRAPEHAWSQPNQFP
jgi:hypothetical protein